MYAISKQNSGHDHWSSPRSSIIIIIIESSNELGLLAFTVIQ